MYEVEVKIKTPHAEMKKDLIESGAVFLGTEEQKDTYFNSPWRDFAKTDEALRIRLVNGKGEVTYKGKKIDTVSKTRTEYNSSVDADAMKEILLALGYFVSGEVNKRRESYRWGDFTIGFDDVEGLGEFIEVEADLRDGADKSKIQNEVRRIFEFLGKYGLTESDSVTTSYLEMVLAKAEKK